MALGLTLGPVLLGCANASTATPPPVGASLSAAQTSEAWNPELRHQADLDPERLRCNARVSWVPGRRDQAAERSEQILVARPSWPDRPRPSVSA